MWHVPRSVPRLVRRLRHLLFLSLVWAGPRVDFGYQIISARLLCCKSRLYAILPGLTVISACFGSLRTMRLHLARVQGRRSDAPHGSIDAHAVRLLSLLNELIDSQTVNLVAHVWGQIYWNLWLGFCGSSLCVRIHFRMVTHLLLGLLFSFRRLWSLLLLLLFCRFCRWLHRVITRHFLRRNTFLWRVTLLWR